jgi:protein-S-isoprenylcysteine O-methyltransferase Ste14
MVFATGDAWLFTARLLRDFEPDVSLGTDRFMGLDIRWPIGLMFSLIGALLVICGLVTGSDAELYKRSLGININLYWGLLLLVFGLAMLFLARRDAQKDKQKGTTTPADKPEEMTSRQ